MVKIHWSVYIILGVAVLFTSYRIDSQKFRLFIWLGYLFLAIGVMKLGIWYVRRKKESPVEMRDVNVYAQQKRGRFCPGCGGGLRGSETFCPGCGQKLR